ncbi:flavin reductase family protein [Sphaerimonospora sp. CA-214678]|uniref:flavin reductase family protein n=1 Tax=Sphaerimonospora sp. CA-214678 TaxID=3240029 RepID=UPI003D8A4D22
MTEILPDRAFSPRGVPDGVGPDRVGPARYHRDRWIPDAAVLDRGVLDRAVDPAGFRGALAEHAAGVVIVTAQVAGVPFGLTATSFSSVSLEPPLVCFFVGRASSTWAGLRRADQFAVHVLTGDQAELAARFARKGIDRFAEPTRWRRGPLGTPLLADVAAHLVCVPYGTAGMGDHVLVVGLVTDVDVRQAARPLLYHRGRFGEFSPGL